MESGLIDAYSLLKVLVGFKYEKTKKTVIFHTVTGTTGQLAQSISKGINSIVNLEAIEFSIEGADIHEGRFTSELA